MPTQSQLTPAQKHVGSEEATSKLDIFLAGNVCTEGKSFPTGERAGGYTENESRTSAALWRSEPAPKSGVPKFVY